MVFFLTRVGTIRRAKNDQAAALFSQQVLATGQRDLRSLGGGSIMSDDFWQRPHTARASMGGASRLSRLDPQVGYRVHMCPRVAVCAAVCAFLPLFFFFFFSFFLCVCCICVLCVYSFVYFLKYCSFLAICSLLFLVVCVFSLSLLPTRRFSSLLSALVLLVE
jgi:hypothetical protein